MRPTVQTSTASQIRTELHRSLITAAAADGGWPYYSGRSSRLEPTSWALLALAGSAGPDRGSRVAGGRAFFRLRQRADGLLVEHGMPGPNYAWNGLALLADTAVGDAHDAFRESLMKGLLKVKGIAVDEPSPARQNNRLQAWPWTEGAFSWIEPTALCVLALKKVGTPGPLARIRLGEAEAMLFDRMCDGGGWNYGNAQVFGQDLRAYVPTTAIALLALRDRRDHSGVKESLDWLRANATAEPSMMALSLATMCLQVFGEDVDEPRAKLQHLISTADHRNNPHLVAMALCALSSEGRGPAALNVG